MHKSTLYKEQCQIKIGGKTFCKLYFFFKLFFQFKSQSVLTSVLSVFQLYIAAELVGIEAHNTFIWHNYKEEP